MHDKRKKGESATFSVWLLEALAQLTDLGIYDSVDRPTIERAESLLMPGEATVRGPLTIQLLVCSVIRCIESQDVAILRC